MTFDRAHLMRLPISHTWVAKSLLVMTLLGLCLFAPGEAGAGEDLGNPQTVFHNMQTFEKDGERIRALRIPVYITLRNWQDRTLGLRLRLAASFAAADLFSLIEQDLTDVKVLSFVPGMEFVFPVGRYHLLRPFADLGGGVDNATDAVVLLGAVGMRTDFIFPTGKYLFGLEPGFQLSFNSGGRIRDEALARPFATLTARRILGFRVGGYLPDAGAYLEGGYDFQVFEWSSVQSTTDRIGINLEVGLGTGFSMGRPKIGPFRVPRLRVGYRFGDLKGIRIRIGGDWLKTLPERKS